jgi:hypothetical protein
VFIVEPDTSEEQIGCLAQIYTGALGGDPWAILGSTYEVAGLVKAPISFDGAGVRATMTAGELGHGSGDTFKNPVTGEDHFAQIVLPDGFIWKKGDCGVGSFEVHAEGLHLKYDNTNWIYYDFDWSN